MRIFHKTAGMVYRTQIKLPLNLLRVAFAAVVCLIPALLPAQTPVVTQHNNNARTGAYTTETLLTPGNVNSTTFGKLFSLPVDGRVYAQPLYVPALAIPGKGTHNVLFVATEHDSIYAFDADSYGGSTAAPLWKITLLDAAHGAAAGATTVPNGDLSTSDIVPEIGITGTPVIDLTTNTMYVVGKTKEGTTASPTYVQRLHAIDITTGAEKFGGPVALSGSVSGTGNGSSGGTLNFDPKWSNNRPGLLLQNGVVYIGFGSHGDNGPWHGWVLSYSASSLQKLGAYCTSPNGAGSGIWMSGGGLAGEINDPTNKPYGRMFIATGNGSFTATAPPYTSSMSYGDDLVNLDLSNGAASPQDSFTPNNQANLNSADEDVASGGVVLLPDQTAGSYPHLLVQAGKEGKLYLVNRESMGGYNSGGDQVVQEVSGQSGGLWSIPAFWNNTLYTWGKATQLKAFTMANGLLPTTASAVAPDTSQFPGATPSVSANGTSNGIVWAVQTDNYNASGNAILRAYNASNVATSLFNSNQVPSDPTQGANNTAGVSTKFVTPTIANGKVYVGTAAEVTVYGLFSSVAQAPAPVISPGSQSFSGSLTITITDAGTSPQIYYTTDGSAPTTSSNKYTGPFTITGNTTVKAIATAVGTRQSPPVSATYSVGNQVATPIISPASTSFSTTLSVTITDTQSGATIYYTTDGSTPTTASTVYSGAITISNTTTVQAIAAASGMSNSAVASATYTYTGSQAGTGSDFVNGFSTATNYMTFNGSTGLADTRLQLTSGATYQAGSAWFNTPQNIQSFTNDFTFQVANAGADGFTFTIQNTGLTALGPSGGGLGYGPDAPGGTPGIGKSVAIKFDFYNNAGEGGDSTGLYTNGASPTTPAVDLTNTGITVGNGDTFSVHMVYNGTTLTMTITDGVTNATYTTSWTVNIPQIVGGNTAYVGFTGGTGGQTASQKIETWTFTPTTASAPQAATPTFSPAAGTYLGTQTVTISDSTAGATIFYTIDGTTPGTAVGGSTMQYTGPVTVTASETINAIATATNYSASAVGSAAYVIQTQVPAPTFSPAGGTYTTAQSVTLGDSLSGATIYYTTDGSTPTTASTKYTGAIAVSSTTTIKAIATAGGFSNSTVASATYTISTVNSINFPNGFAGGGMVFNGNTALSGTRVRLTNASSTYQAGSAWFSTPVSTSSFTTDFTFQITPGTSPTADGFAFVIQNNNTAALGPNGGGLGYGADTAGTLAGTRIQKSVAIKFDLYSNSGETADSTGIYSNGASPTTPYVDLTNSGINLHTTDTFAAHITYDGSNLVMTLTDTNTAASFTQTWPINIPTTIGSNTAYFGFTGGTGGLTAIQDIITWTYSSGGALLTTATPAFSPAGGTYTSAQSVSLSDATSGATIYYTTDGSTPTTASTPYTAPISVGATTTINAIAAASGYSNSPVASATYTIQLPAATPTFSPAAGTYTSAQSVTISDTTAGATIYYTTDGSTPTTASTKYTGAIAVNSTTTIKAIATATGFSTSPVGTAAYTILTAAATPTFSPAAGTYTSAQSVTISDATAGATIYYTTDGSTPTTASTKYTAPISVGATTTLNAIAVATGFNNSAVGTAVYTIQLPAATPTFSPAAGTYASAQTVTISDATLGATIYFTTDGTTPTTASTKYTAPISVATNLTLKAIATATGSSTSAVGSAAYTILTAAATPTFSPAGGTYASAQSVTISDTTTGATIYYTTDGSTPTTASTKYTAAIAVSATTTIKAIAVASGFNNSAVASATYTILTPAATPAFSPAGGTYTSAQSVTISDSTAGATIYYTTDGSTPTTASTKYTAPIAVSSSATIKAIAAASGFNNSAVATATYTINPTTIGFSNGFTAGGVALNGNAALSGTRLRLVSGATYQTGSAWYPSLLSTAAFTTDFTFQVTPGTATLADGLAFVIQNNATTAIGPGGGGLGYGADTAGVLSANRILNSAAIKFDLYNNSGETADSTGLYLNGASPTTPFTDMTNSGVNPASGHVIAAHITYDGANLALTLTDTTTSAVFSQTWAVNLPASIGSSTAYFGFTGATGGLTSIQDIISWTYTPGAPSIPAAAAPTFTPAGGTYTSAQSVTLADATTGATIYYTTDGSTPTTASNKYTAAIAVSATTTINAIAVASGYSNSPVATATYTISGGTAAINFAGGFASAAGLRLNGGSALSGTRLRVTDGGTYEATSAYWATPVSVQSFTTDFTFQQAPGTSPTGDGFAFVLQNLGITAVGGYGGSLGYAPAVTNSVAIKFDLYSNDGEGTNSTGLYVNGAAPTTPAVDMTSSGVVLQSGHVMRAHITYDGTTLILTVTDTVTGAEFTTNWAVNLPTTIGANTAYAGFTGGTGASTAVQDVITWTYKTGAPTAAVSYSTTALTAVSSGPTFRTFSYAGFPDGTGTILDATAPGDNVTFTINVAQAGTYDVSYTTKETTTRGFVQLAISGTNVGPVIDQYAAADTYSRFDLGNVNFSAPGNYSFTFSVTGKNASSGGYSIAFDDIILTPQ